jgi:hypothetical protein
MLTLFHYNTASNNILPAILHSFHPQILFKHSQTNSLPHSFATHARVRFFDRLKSYFFAKAAFLAFCSHMAAIEFLGFAEGDFVYG